MKTKLDPKSLTIGALVTGVAITLIAAAEPPEIQVPVGTSYTVKIGEDVYLAKTVQVHGKWVQLNGVHWKEGVGPRKKHSTIIAPRSSVKYIDVD